ncbi:MAG: peptide chain release factor N(5)-glutamine methyltransferase [Alphaproteobacteria bacterium]|nr:peptide chain release factor N(5)-glutamine methyltransferase [Alphaproteobacteria bacterium]MBM3949951.1 peptide chain release factor N(5)-glutamine methyltransferase [Rhodospirillales bacterium]
MTYLSVPLARRLAEAARVLAGAGIEDAPREARRLAELALQASPAEVFARKAGPLAPPEEAAFARLVAARAARVPFARLAGEREFWSLSFRLNAATLVPRPESETLIEAALARVRDRSARLRVLDLGTGSGCLLLALLAELPRATGLGVDAEPAALACARANAARLGLARRVRWRRNDWTKALVGPFDIVLANPPYVTAREWQTLEPEVRFYDPKPALVGGRDGLAAYRRIVPRLSRLLGRAGFACLEIGWRQEGAVCALARRAGLRVAEIRRDLAGRPRCVVLATAPAKSRSRGRGPKIGVGKVGNPD